LDIHPNSQGLTPGISTKDLTAVSMDDDVQVPEITKIHQRFRVGNEELGKHGHFEKNDPKEFDQIKSSRTCFTWPWIT